MKLCSKCGKLSHYNSYFGAYICEVCGYREPVSKKMYVVPKSASSSVSGRYTRERQAEPELVSRN